MAIKIKKKYRVVNAMNPKTGVKDLLRPVVTERETYYSDNVVEYALKNGYVRGQYHDMLGALNGFIQAVQELGKEGKDVNLSNWLRVHGELNGTVDPKNPVLTDKNVFHVNITALKELKRKASDFSWTKVEDAAAPAPDKEPKLTSFAQIDEDGNVISEGAINALYSRIEVRGENIPEGIKARYAVYGTDGVLKADTSWDPLPQNTPIERISDSLIRAQFIRNVSVSPDGTWWENGNPLFFEVMLPSGEIIKIGLKNT